MKSKSFKVKVAPAKIIAEEKTRIWGLLGSFQMDPIDKELIWKIYEEAQRKYRRMHYATPAERFEKSWIGEIGEGIVEVALREYFKLEVERPELGLEPEKQPDLIFTLKGKVQKIANITARELSTEDNVHNVFFKPHEYLVLIPRDQWEQYQEAHFCFPVFIKAESTIKYSLTHGILSNEYMLVGEVLKVITLGTWAFPGFLRKEDLEALKFGGFISGKKRFDLVKGLYNNMKGHVKMYSDNYVIYVNLLRNLEELLSYIQKGNL